LKTINLENIKNTWLFINEALKIRDEWLQTYYH